MQYKINFNLTAKTYLKVVALYHEAQKRKYLLNTSLV
jgi:hypothetical protein